jgi:hypothetical protein
MIIISIILSFVALAYLCWLLFVLAVYALPFFVGTAVALVAHHNGSGPMAAIVIGAIASGVALVAARLAFTTLRSPFARALIASVFQCRRRLRDTMLRSVSLTSAPPPTAGSRPSQSSLRLSSGPRLGHALRSLPRPNPDKASRPA